MENESSNDLGFLDMESYYMDSFYTVSVDTCSACEKVKIVYCINISMLIVFDDETVEEEAKDFILRVCPGCIEKGDNESRKV